MNQADDIGTRIERAVPEVLAAGIGAAAERIADKSRWTRNAAWRMDEAGRRRHRDDDVPDSVDDLASFEDVIAAAFGVHDGFNALEPGEMTIEELRDGRCRMDAALALELMEAARAAADEIARAARPDREGADTNDAARTRVMEALGFESGPLYYAALNGNGDAIAENETHYPEGGEIRRFDRLLINAVNEAVKEDHVDEASIADLSDHSAAEALADINDGRWRHGGGGDTEDECHERSVRLLLALKEKVARAAGAA